MQTQPPLQALSDEEVRRVHEAALAILERTGARFADTGARNILAERGARVEGERVFFPAAFISGTLALVRPALAQVVLEVEMAEAAKRLRRGIGVTEETLALPVIDACARGESFPGQEHTVAHLRSQLWQPRVFFRGTWEEVTPDGILAAARERAADLRARQAPPPLPEDMAAELDRILARGGPGGDGVNGRPLWGRSVARGGEHPGE